MGELSSIREQVDPPIATSTPMTKSCTSDSLARPPPSKDCSPSMMSSGYESQAISSSTLSSEESLSLADEAERVVMRKRSGENLNNESFIEQYTKGAAAVQDLLQLDRMRQSVAVKEALAAKMRQYDPIQSLRKTHSVPNIRHNMKGSYSLDSLVRLQPSESFAELNLDEKVQRRLPLSLTMSTLHEEKTGRKSRASPELSSIREQVDPPIATSTPITKSCTSDSLARPPPSKDCSPSMMSSGYESQAISSSTLSSEESLSLADEAEKVVMRKRTGENLNNENRLSCPPGTLRQTPQ